MQLINENYVYVMQNKFVIHGNISTLVAFLCMNVGHVVCIGTDIYFICQAVYFTPYQSPIPNLLASFSLPLHHQIKIPTSDELNPLNVMDMVYSPNIGSQARPFICVYVLIIYWLTFSSGTFSGCGHSSTCSYLSLGIV